MCHFFHCLKIVCFEKRSLPQVKRTTICSFLEFGFPLKEEPFQIRPNSSDNTPYALGDANPNVFCRKTQLKMLRENGTINDVNSSAVWHGASSFLGEEPDILSPDNMSTSSPRAVVTRGFCLSSAQSLPCAFSSRPSRPCEGLLDRHSRST